MMLAACAPSPVPPPVVAEVPAVRSASYADARWGQELLASQGCIACHSPRQPSPVGPSLDSMVRGTRTFQDGTTLDVSGPEGQSYLSDSITSPSARVVVGFQPVMPTYAGHLNEAQIMAVLAYLRCFGEGACEQSPECAEVDACQTH